MTIKENILYIIAGIVLLGALLAEPAKEEYWQEIASRPTPVTVAAVHNLCMHINEREIKHKHEPPYMLDCDDLFPKAVRRKEK